MSQGMTRISIEQTSRKPGAPQFAKPLIPYRVAFLISIAVAMLSYAIALLDLRGLYVAFAAQLLAVTLLVAIWKGPPSLTGWDLVVVSVVAGSLIRAYYFVTVRPSQEIIDFFFLRGQKHLDLMFDASLYALAVGLVGVGFWFSFRHEMGKEGRRGTLLVANVRRPGRARAICVLIGLSSLVVLYAFAQVTGGIDVQNFSAKRAIRLHEEATVGYENILRMFSYLSMPAAVLHLGLRPAHHLFRWRLGNVLLLMLALTPAVYGSSRSELALVGVLFLAVLRLTAQRIRPLGVFLLALLVLTLFTLVSAARSTSADRELLVNPISIETMDSLALNRSMLDYTRLANLRIALARGWSDFRLGDTLTAPFLAPIPRAVWPTKPPISPGLDFAKEVYGTDAQGGVPPDGPTELYWNFGMAGMLVLAPFAGMILGSIEANVRRKTTGNVFWFPYLMGPFFLTYRWVSISFTHAITLTLQTMTVAWLVFMLAGGRIHFLRREVVHPSSFGTTPGRTDS
jgi:hypothetical protein